MLFGNVLAITPRDMAEAGIILIIAMLIAPGAIGLLLVRTFDRMSTIVVGASVLSCIAGAFISYHFDTAIAPLIVIIEGVLFLGALLATTLSAARKMPDLSPRQARSPTAWLLADGSHASASSAAPEPVGWRTAPLRCWWRTGTAGGRA